MADATAGLVTVETGVVVGTGGGRDLRADVFTPPPGTANGTGVLLVHGGAWLSGDRTQLRGYGILLGRIGYTSVACEYRLSGEAKWPAQIHDAKAALRWMRKNSERLGIDPNKIAVEGNSAGGHLALMIAGTPGVAEFEGAGGNPGVPTDVAACVAFYAPAMLSRPGEALASHRIALFRDGVSDDEIRSASPISHASSAFPPTLLITGNQDRTVPDRSSFAMYRALVDAGAKAELHVYEGAPHAFDAVSEFGRQCASIMALFLDRHIVNPRPILRSQPATVA